MLHGKPTDCPEDLTNATLDGLVGTENSFNTRAGSAVKGDTKDAAAQVGRDDGESTGARCGVEESTRRSIRPEQAGGRCRDSLNEQQQLFRTDPFEDESLDMDLEGNRGGGVCARSGTKDEGKDEGIEDYGIPARHLRSILKVKTVAEGLRAKLIVVGGKTVRFDVVPGMGPGDGVGEEAAQGGSLRVGRKESGDVSVTVEGALSGPLPPLERQGSVTFKPDAEGEDWGMPSWTGSVMNLMNLREMVDAAMEEEETEEALAGGLARRNSVEIYESKGATPAEEEWVMSRAVPDHVKNPSKYTCYSLDWGEEDEESQNRAALEAVTQEKPTATSPSPPLAPTFVAPAWSATRRGRGKGHQRITLDGSGDSGSFLSGLEVEGVAAHGKGVSVWAAQAAEQEEGEGGVGVEAMDGTGGKKGSGRAGRQYRNRQLKSGVDSESEQR